MYSYLIQGVQDLLLAYGLHLLFVKNIARPAILCAQSQHVLISKAHNRPFQNSSAACTDADFAGDLGA